MLARACLPAEDRGRFAFAASEGAEPSSATRMCSNERPTFMFPIRRSPYGQDRNDARTQHAFGCIPTSVHTLAAVRPHHNESGCVAFRDIQNGRHRIAFFRMGHGSNTACLRALRSRSQYGTRACSPIASRSGAASALGWPIFAGAIMRTTSKAWQNSSWPSCSFARSTASASACSDGSDPSMPTNIRAKSDSTACVLTGSSGINRADLHDIEASTARRMAYERGVHADWTTRR